MRASYPQCFTELDVQGVGNVECPNCHRLFLVEAEPVIVPNSRYTSLRPPRQRS